MLTLKTRLVMSATVAGLAGTANAQFLTASYGLPWAPPDEMNTVVLYVELTSFAFSAGPGVMQVDDSAAFIRPGQFDPCFGDFAPESAAASFIWFSIQGDGSFFPKIWEGAFNLSALLPNECEWTAAMASWQTAGPVVTTAGIAFTTATWDIFEGTGGNPGFTAGNAMTWSLGTPPSPSAPLSDLTLAAKFGDDQHVRLESEVLEFGNLYLYSYRVYNNTDEPATVNWTAAGLVVELEPGEEHVSHVIAPRPGRESQELASISGGVYDGTTMIANAILPMGPAVFSVPAR